MAKEVLSVRLSRTLKLWVEHKAEKLDTTEAWIVEQSLIQMAGDDLPSGFDARNPSKTERRKK